MHVVTPRRKYDYRSILAMLKDEILPSGETVAVILNVPSCAAVCAAYILTGSEHYLVLVFLVANLSFLDLIIVVKAPVQIGDVFFIQLVHKGEHVVLCGGSLA